MRPLLAVFDLLDLLRGNPVLRADFAIRARIGADRDHLLGFKFLWPLAASVLALRQPPRPAAVSRFIAAIVIDAIQRQFRRAFAHVSKEMCERQPALTYDDAPTDVILGLRMVPGRAALHHIPPSRVGPRLLSAVR